MFIIFVISNRDKCATSLKQIEKYVRDNYGFQALYADTFLTPDEFRKMFDHRTYDRLRKQYKCDGRLPVVYDKVCRKARR